MCSYLHNEPSPTWEQTKNQQEEAGGIREASCSQDLLDGQWGRGEAWVTLWTQLRAKATGEPEERGLLGLPNHCWG